MTNDYERWIHERAVVLSLENNSALWVAADKASACGSCKARSGCGTSLLAKLGAKQVAVRAVIPESLRRECFHPGEEVELAIDRTAFLKVALVMYLVPLLGLLLGVLVALPLSDFYTAIVAFLGLMCGGWLASRLLKQWRNDECLQPVVLRRALAVDQSVISFH